MTVRPPTRTVVRTPGYRVLRALSLALFVVGVALAARGAWLPAVTVVLFGGIAALFGWALKVRS